MLGLQKLDVRVDAIGLFVAVGVLLQQVVQIVVQ